MKPLSKLLTPIQSISGQNRDSELP